MSIFSAFNSNSGNDAGASNSGGLANQNSFFRRTDQSDNTAGRAETGEVVKNSIGVVDNLIARQGGGNSDVGKAIRMVGNAAQLVFPGAAPVPKSLPRVILNDMLTGDDTVDWRVSLSVPNVVMQGPIIAELAKTKNRMIFPFTPTILLGHTANYSNVQPIHSNYPYHAYENSQVDNITITGEFYNENQEDAKYWIACLHYLRAMTKMFSGASTESLGNPPPVARLNGYGKHVLNNIPVVITNFTTDMPADVDYIECEVAGEIDYVPTQSVFTVTVAPNYARRSQARFSFQDFINGNHTSGPEGFV